MNKTKKVIYWIATIWLSLGMLSSAIVQLLMVETEIKFILDLGYPRYLLTWLGIWKILGVIVLLVPGFHLLKEWAYAGFFFIMSGALFSHLVMSDPLNETFPSVLLLVLTMLSWYLRPATRKLAVLTNNKLYEPKS